MELASNHRRLAVIIGLIALVLAAGLVVVATDGSSGSGRAAAASPATTDTVAVSGTGSVEGVPDTLIADLRVHTHGSSVQDALNLTAVDAHKVITTLHDRGVALTDIKNTDLSLNPHYDYHGNPAGYDAGESLSVRIHPLTKVGQILSAAATAAGNSVSVDGLSFDIADNTTLLAGARKAAFDNAKAAAAQYASLSGRSLARVMTIRAVVHHATPIPFAAGSAGVTDSFHRAVAAVPIRPGQKKVSVTVSVVWALQ
jgi:uncharacterized protein YggE